MPRDGFLGASQFAAAIGISPYCSRAEAWRLITGRTTFEGNDATRHGQQCEPLAIAAYEAHTGDIVTDQQRWYSSEYLGTHIDGRVAAIVTEFKCPFVGIYEAVPEHYMPQIQGQMRLTGEAELHFVAWTPDDLRIWRVPYNAEYWLWMRPLLDAFWDCVERDIEPERLKRRPKHRELETERIA